MQGSSTGLRLATSVSATSSFAWTIPPTVETYLLGNVYKIKIWDATDTNFTDSSDNYFSINAPLSSLTVTSPTTANYSTRPNSISIAWSVQNMPTDSRYTLRYSNTRMGSEEIAYELPASTRSYNWVLPSSITSGTYKISVCGNGNYGMVCGQSIDFVIVSPTTYIDQNALANISDALMKIIEEAKKLFSGQ
jgi:hypothetical protein